MRAKNRTGLIEFHNLQVEVGNRVWKEWKAVPKKTICALKDAAKIAFKAHKKRHVFRPIEKILREELTREREIRAELNGPGWLNDIFASVWAKNYELLAVTDAVKSQNATALKKIAARIERREKRASSWRQEYDEGFDAVLLNNWLSNDSLCLAWFSTGALEWLLREVGLWGKDAKPNSLEAHYRRMGLKPLRPGIIHTKHLNFRDSILKIE